MWQLLRTFSWRELRHHPWRNAAAVVAVMLGVALAFSVHLINASALSAFDAATRTVSGQPDLSLRTISGGLDENLLGEVAHHPLVAIATPVLEANTTALMPGGARIPLRVLGVDAITIAQVAPSLMPMPFPASPGLTAAGDTPAAGPTAGDAQRDDGSRRLDMFAPDAIFLSPSAAASVPSGATLSLQVGMRQPVLRIAGLVPGTLDGGSGDEAANSGASAASIRASTGGPALAVMDIGAAQDLLGEGGRLTRIDVRLLSHAAADGQLDASIATLTRDLRSLPGGGQVTIARPDDAHSRVDALSKAYRVNLTVLALVALFTGGFLVFSVLSLSVSKRAQQIALLGVLGLTPGQRLRLVLLESVALGAVGTVLGLLLGAGLAKGALSWLGGDLGGGYFPGLAPRLQWDGMAALVYGILGLLAALIAGWWPARTAQRLPAAQTLKGLGWSGGDGRWRRFIGVSLIALGALLSAAPPVGGLPLAAYASVGLILIGGVVALPGAVALLVDAARPLLAHRVLPLLAVERARRQRETAAVAISGVVAALSLAVALTVMVSSFRHSVTTWLDNLLPADLYVRMAQAGTGSQALFDAGFVQAAAQLPGVQRLTAQRVLPLSLSPTRPPVTLIARPMGNPRTALPLVGEPVEQTGPERLVAVYVSEAYADLYDQRPGDVLVLSPQPSDARAGFVSAPAARAASAAVVGGARDLSPSSSHPAPMPVSPIEPISTDAKRTTDALAGARFFIAGVWRDYARQHGSIAIDSTDFTRLTQDQRANDLAIWLQNGTPADDLQSRIRALADDTTPGLGNALEMASSQQIRATSLRIFDRSFAVTYWLQAVAIGIGLFGVAASFSAQVLARRKEFGLLVHLGLTRPQILKLVALEGLTWTLIGAVAGLCLGLVVAIVLVDVVNPQSFHWTMDMAVPWSRLMILCAALVAAGTLTAWLSGRANAKHDAVLAVKEDW